MVLIYAKEHHIFHVGISHAFGVLLHPGEHDHVAVHRAITLRIAVGGHSLLCGGYLLSGSRLLHGLLLRLSALLGCGLRRRLPLLLVSGLLLLVGFHFQIALAAVGNPSAVFALAASKGIQRFPALGGFPGRLTHLILDGRAAVSVLRVPGSIIAAFVIRAAANEPVTLFRQPAAHLLKDTQCSKPPWNHCRCNAQS